uniref:Aquaporin n=1 Tax=Heterorhabditis bacteriophora TaxID=37862 RepID=A0A1I7X2P7_HETBA
MRVWVASLIFYSFVFTVCEILRYLIIILVPDLKRLSAQLLLEFVGTLQICAPMFDVGIIMDTYGLFGVFIEITILELANCYFQRDVTSCCRQSKIIRRAIYVFLTQLAAAYVSFFLAQSFWKIGVHPLHFDLLQNEHCTADLTVALTTGCLVEGIATFVGKTFEEFVNDNYEDEWKCSLINCIFSGFVCAIGINFTGMYANPIVAWACTFNCEGVSHIGHLTVYWLSPLIGWYLAEMVFAVDNEQLLDGIKHRD